MGWFERHLDGREPEELETEIGRYLRAAGVDRALVQMCGPYGVRRFVIRYAEQDGRVVLTDMETHPLPFGGGPPDPRGAEEALQPLEAAVGRLHRNMMTNLPWNRGAVAVTRDAEDHMEIVPLFDDDSDGAQLSDLDMPGPPGHPLEGHEYRQMVAGNEAGMASVHAQTSKRRGSWKSWDVPEENDALVLEHEGGATRHRARVLGTFHPSRNRFEWASEKTLFDEPVFSTPAFSITMDVLMELGFATTARLGADWLFIDAYNDKGDIVLISVWG